ncbi:hypothetical protein CPC08DRAFT_730297 [Agrocybe pediades]|nr:hypothetical protein CPC08DRAFT_730297 [Agrocybe pediades]
MQVAERLQSQRLDADSVAEFEFITRDLFKATEETSWKLFCEYRTSKRGGSFRALGGKTEVIQSGIAATMPDYNHPATTTPHLGESARLQRGNENGAGPPGWRSLLVLLLCGEEAVPVLPTKHDCQRRLKDTMSLSYDASRISDLLNQPKFSGDPFIGVLNIHDRPSETRLPTSSFNGVQAQVQTGEEHCVSAAWEVKPTDETVHIPSIVVRHLFKWHFGVEESAVGNWQMSYDSLLRSYGEKVWYPTLAPMDIISEFEQSSRWPDDVKAFQTIRTFRGRASSVDSRMFLKQAFSMFFWVLDPSMLQRYLHNISAEEDPLAKRGTYANRTSDAGGRSGRGLIHGFDPAHLLLSDLQCMQKRWRFFPGKTILTVVLKSVLFGWLF